MIYPTRIPDDLHIARNDRSLRHIITGLGPREDGVPREAEFDITAASEVMAVLALAVSLQDLRDRLGRIVISSSTSDEPITAEDLKAAGKQGAGYGVAK